MQFYKVELEDDREVKRMKPEGIILWHRDGMGSVRAFDVFVRKGKIRKYKKQFDWLYQVDCLFAEVFQETFKSYKYIGSEDDLHLFPINLEIPKKFKVITLLTWPKDKKKAKQLIKKDLIELKDVVE